MVKLLIFVLTFFQLVVVACTAAVVSGEATPDGRPLLWKNRDSLSIENAVGWFEGEKYAFSGVINSDDPEGEEIWMGLNTAGFAIMNTHSYNIPVGEDWEGELDQEGLLMREALGICETVSDFEEFLEDTEGEWGITANFGGIDRYGEAALFECGPDKFVKLDASNSRHAPLGFIVTSNFSVSENHERGRGMLRYQRANDLFTEAYLQDNITPQFILQEVTRDLYNPALGKNVMNKNESKMPLIDTILRQYSVSTMVVQGVTPEEDPVQSVAWVIAGFPLTIPAVPFFAHDVDTVPSFAKAGEYDNTCLLNETALDRKEKIQPYNYITDAFYLSVAQTRSYLEQIIQEENDIFQLYEKRKAMLQEPVNLEVFYEEVEEIIDFSN